VFSRRHGNLQELTDAGKSASAASSSAMTDTERNQEQRWVHTPSRKSEPQRCLQVNGLRDGRPNHQTVLPNQTGNVGVSPILRSFIVDGKSSRRGPVWTPRVLIQKKSHGFAGQMSTNEFRPLAEWLRSVKLGSVLHRVS
jgi:hypothetical protein